MNATGHEDLYVRLLVTAVIFATTILSLYVLDAVYVSSKLQ